MIALLLAAHPERVGEGGLRPVERFSIVRDLVADKNTEIRIGSDLPRISAIDLPVDPPAVAGAQG